MNGTVLITGSTRGIGLATAAIFLRHGDKVLIFCRHRKHVEEAKKHLPLTGFADKILGLVGDVRKVEDVRSIVARCLRHFGRIDILINNAGIAIYKKVEGITEKKWDEILDTNLKGTFLFMHEILPVMKEQGSGIIINVSSGLGVAGEANFSAYCASKFGVVGLTQAVADEVADSGVKVYAVLPGAVKTKLYSDLGLEMNPANLLSPEYVARRIFDVAKGIRRTGQSIEIYG